MNIGKGFLVCIFKTHTCQVLLQSRGNLLDHYDLDSFTPHMNVMLLVQFQHGINYVLLVPNQYTSLSTIFLLVRFFVSSSIKWLLSLYVFNFGIKVHKNACKNTDCLSPSNIVVDLHNLILREIIIWHKCFWPINYTPKFL